MSLHLIVDGYNVIRQVPRLQSLDARDLEAGRAALLEALAAYRRTRPVHQVTVVFDGWQGGELQESRDRYRGLAVVYSRRGERADEVIKRLLHQEGRRAVVVSSDRELQIWARNIGAAWMAAAQFARLHLEGAGDSPEEHEEGFSPLPGKKGPARRLPKPERRRRQRLRKL
jgi:predicted RNA-binding protein with PIN domain